MKPAHAAEMLRGQVMALHDTLAAAPVLRLDDTDETALLRLVSELDRLSSAIEDRVEAQR